MFKASMSKSGLLRDSIQGISELISEGVFEIKKDGIYFKGTDPTMVTLVDFKLFSSVFDSYEVDSDQKISINLDNLISILRRANPSDKVLLELDSKENKFVVVLEGDSTRRFSIPLIDVEQGEIPEMKLNFPASLELKSNVFIDGIEDAFIITDTVILGAHEKEFTMKAIGDLNQMELKLEKGHGGLVNLNAKKEVSSKFSLDYMKKIAKAGKLTDKVQIFLGKDYPIRILFSQKDKLELSYTLAPRVED